MAPFRDRLDDYQRLDWHILQNGAIALYHRPSILDEDRAWLAANRYGLFDFDSGAWRHRDDFHDDVKRTLAFAGFYGRNLAAFVDALSELKVPEDGGTAIVLRHFDRFMAVEPELATAVLEALETTSRFFLLFGRRFVGLVQCDEARVRVSAVGARPVLYNPQEREQANRAMRPTA
ncbi:MAG TPA: barstar family protein [Gemmatimonadaceae bacterium]|nr:barstar family protein [Gemmatimonadaceae bacterium]